MSLTGVIASLNGQAYTVTRTAIGGYTDGIYAAGAASSVNIVAGVQPVTGKELKNLPEARHTEAIVVIYTTTELFTRSASNEPDKLTVDGLLYEVFKVENWRAFDGGHWRAYATANTAQATVP